MNGSLKTYNINWGYLPPVQILFYIEQRFLETTIHLQKKKKNSAYSHLKKTELIYHSVQSLSDITNLNIEEDFVFNYLRLECLFQKYNFKLMHN